MPLDPSGTYTASGDINPCRAVKGNGSGDFGCTEADANEVCIGISGKGTRRFDSALHAAAGDPCLVYKEGAECLMQIGSGGCSAFGYLKSDADGKGVAIATSGATAQAVVAQAQEAGADGDFIRVIVKIIPKYYPALS